LLHLVGFDFIELPTLKMHGQTQIKHKSRKKQVLHILNVCLQLGYPAGKANALYYSVICGLSG
jgi:hypothetical protein